MPLAILSSDWIALGAIFVWCLLAVLVGEYAARKGRSAWGFTALAVVTSPLLGLVVAILAEDRMIRRTPGLTDTSAELVRLGQLREAGHLTEEEFVQAKSQALGGIHAE